MKKELRPIHDDVSCDICGRTILKGERTEAYLAPGGQRHVVCELCTDRAYNEGWIREAAHDETPATMRRPDQRRGLVAPRRPPPGRARARWGRAPGPGAAGPARVVEEAPRVFADETGAEPAAVVEE